MLGFQGLEFLFVLFNKIDYYGRLGSKKHRVTKENAYNDPYAE
jgi:hypothetical protein